MSLDFGAKMLILNKELNTVIEFIFLFNLQCVINNFEFIVLWISVMLLFYNKFLLEAYVSLKAVFFLAVFRY